MSTPLTVLHKAPPFLLATSLLLWGWQTGFLVFAIPMLVVLEMANWVKWRWPVSEKEFNTLADVSGVSFFIVVVYLFSTEGAKGIFVILSAMPFILFPLLLVQMYSEQGKIGVPSLFVSLRKLNPRITPEAGAKIDISLPYLIICIISASSGNQRTIWFYILCFILLSTLLWFYRPKRYRLPVWIGLLILAFNLGYIGQQGLRELQGAIESSIIGMFDQFMWRYRDPERVTTAIGTIGRLKLSDRIVIRVNSDTPLNEPLLLHEASYHRYTYGVWSNSLSDFTVIDPELDGSVIIGEGDARQSVTISTYMPREIAVIPLPHGTSRISDVAAVVVSQNQYNSVKMEIREGWINYRSDFRSNFISGEPNADDLEVPAIFKQDLDLIAQELKLYEQPPQQAVDTITRFFLNDFKYSLNQRGRYPRGRYLYEFLYNTRSGHCEYFATSTVMLLRMAGIPARYAVGYVIDEYSRMEGQYIARSRDAHSWAMAYINGSWQVVDTTPSEWAPYEDENASLIQPLMDLFSWFSYRIAQFQTRDELEEEQSNYNLLYLLIPLVMILIWRLYFKERIQQRKKRHKKKKLFNVQGNDSRFYELVKALNNAGYLRRKGETQAAWFKRITESLKIHNLENALKLHYRYRFDPSSYNEQVRAEISALVDQILESGKITDSTLAT
jgi:hypothetical protein